MNLWASLCAVRRLLLSGLVAFFCWMAIANSPLWSRPAFAVQEAVEKPGDHDRASPDIKEEPQAERSPLDHVLDSSDWELFESFGAGHFHLPKIDGPPTASAEEVIEHQGRLDFSLGFQITKFMVLEIVAALLIVAVYVPLAWRVREGGIPRGSFTNFFEVLLTFIRDQVAKPGVGEHDADRFVPFLWTLFLFILINNLLGLVPLFGSATGSLFVTLGLALWVFFYMHGNAVAKMGLGKYIASMWPHIDVPFPMGFFIKPLIFVIEWIGVLVRNLVLAVRLFANMFAGHMVVATFLLFIWMARNVHIGLWSAVTLSSVTGIVALSLLELFVAFLQAYIFTFLTALFMGMALHPEH